MYTLHLKPEWNNDYIGQIDGAIALVIVDFADVGGALILAQFYAQKDNWKVTNVEEDISTIKNKNDLAPEMLPAYKWAKKEGYSIALAPYGNGQK
jgi:hypothetical protein